MVVEGNIEFFVKDYSGNIKVQDLGLINAAVDYYLGKLWSETEYNGKAEIQVNLVKELLSEHSGLTDRYGEMYEGVDAETGSKYYVIDLDSEQSLLEIFKTLAHEMVHVLQSYDGRLVVNQEGWFWHGASFGSTPYDGLDPLPWEVEASELETPLALSYTAMLYSITHN